MVTAVRKKGGNSSPSKVKDAPVASSPLISDARLKQLYSTMLQCRLLGDRAHALRKVKGTAEPIFGGEAVAVGAALDLRRDDWIVLNENDVLGKFVKGVKVPSILSKIREGKTTRTSKAQAPAAIALEDGDSLLHIVTSVANPAAQLNVAAGAAVALQGGKTGNIVMAFCGDISDSGKRWREALAFAARHCLPLVVLVHTRTSLKRASKKAQKTFASLVSEGYRCELPMIPVDGNDVVAIYRVAFESIHKARHGGGPTLIQAISFPASLRNNAGSSEYSDAITKMEAYLTAKGLFSPSWKQTLIDNFKRELESSLTAGKKRHSRNRE